MNPRDVARSYGLSVGDVRLLPGGYHAASYVLDDVYVLKFYAVAPDLRLVAHLDTCGVSVAPPIQTPDGKLTVETDDGFAALFAFIAGVTPPSWPAWPEPVLRRLGEVLAIVHSVRPSIPVPLDDLAIPFEPDLTAMLRGDIPFRNEVAEQLDRLRELHIAARATVWEPVLCHTDAAGDNILVTPAGELVLLDWDEAVMGPVENDFALLARDERPGDDALATVLRAHGGRLDPDRLAFCMLRRYLGDAAVRLARPPLDLDDFLMWCVLPWRGM